MNCNRKYKIAFFVDSFPSISETFIVNQIIGLLDAGHQVCIYAQTKATTNIVHPVINEYKLLDKTIFLEDFPKDRLKKVGILLKGFLNQPLFVGKWIFLFLNNKKNWTLSVYSLLPFLKCPQYDVVHAHFGNVGNYLAQLRNAGMFKNAKFVATFHGYDMMVKPIVYTKLFNSDVTITVNSEYSKNQIIKLGCPISKIDILPVGLDTTYFQRKNFQHQIFTLLFVGRLISLKGPNLFINICKELADRYKMNFKAVMIGEGELKQQLELQIESLKLTSIIELAGAKTQNQIRQYMHRANLFVLPGITDNGRAEAQGLVIQEAQSMQLPVLVSDAGGMQEGMQDGITGFVIKEGDIKGFADKIIFLVQDQQLRRRMGEKGSIYVESFFDTRLLTEKLIKLYKRL